MIEAGVYPDEFTFVKLLGASSFLRVRMDYWKLLQPQLIRFDVEMSLVLKTTVLICMQRNALDEMYKKCSHTTTYGVKVFRGIASPNVITWTSLAAGFIEHDLEEETFQLFADMQAAGVQPNSFTLSTILGACTEMNSLTLTMKLLGMLLLMLMLEGG
ncbi:hypothetical protein Fmac_020666 [Flemingia macrophylla]|uniref:Pentatricopeptide repeat-containing protein n=1 Tax=Flemingia macrophylla TaxID=520843 RepID=A0ABD1LUQ1_9FABA